MNEIVKVEQEQIGEKTVQAVNARELHNFLGVGKMFAHWIKERIEKYGFTEGEDYIVFAKSGKNPLGGRPEIEYHISVDMAKQLTMVENNIKGRQIRKYFIECEKKLNAFVKPTKEIKGKSKEARKGIAAEWQRHGANAPKHFINLTYAEYKTLGYAKPRSVSKDKMSAEEISRLTALEVFESIKLSRLPGVTGYYELRDSIEASGKILQAAIDTAVFEYAHRIGA